MNAKWAVVVVAALAGLPRSSHGAQAPPASKPAVMPPGALQALTARPPDHRISYGEDQNQFGELRLPDRSGPHPVVVLVHGGCWKAQYATLRDLAPMADALEDDGIATWNIEYR